MFQCDYCAEHDSADEVVLTKRQLAGVRDRSFLSTLLQENKPTHVCPDCLNFLALDSISFANEKEVDEPIAFTLENVSEPRHDIVPRWEDLVDHHIDYERFENETR